MLVILQERFRQRVRAELESRGWSQGELARRMNVSPQFVSQYLNGQRSPGLDLVQRFSETFDLNDPIELLEPSVVAK